MELGRIRVRGFLFCALGFEVLRLLRARVRGFASFAGWGSRFCALCALGFEILRLLRFCAFCAQGFEVLRLLRARVRGFAPWARQGSRFYVFCALGFEVLRLGALGFENLTHFWTRVATLVSRRSLGLNNGRDPRPENGTKWDNGANPHPGGA